MVVALENRQEKRSRFTGAGDGGGQDVLARDSGRNSQGLDGRGINEIKVVDGL